MGVTLLQLSAMGSNASGCHTARNCQRWGIAKLKQLMTVAGTRLDMVDDG